MAEVYVTGPDGTRYGPYPEGTSEHEAIQLARQEAFDAQHRNQPPPPGPITGTHMMDALAAQLAPGHVSHGGLENLLPNLEGGTGGTIQGLGGMLDYFNRHFVGPSDPVKNAQMADEASIVQGMLQGGRQMQADAEARQSPEAARLGDTPGVQVGEIGSNIVQSAPGMASMVIPGAAAERVVQGSGGIIGSLLEGAQGGGQGYDQARESAAAWVIQHPDEFAHSEIGRRALAQSNGNLTQAFDIAFEHAAGFWPLAVAGLDVAFSQGFGIQPGSRLHNAGLAKWLDQPLGSSGRNVFQRLFNPIASGFLREGVLEELPQSVQEQVGQNVIQSGINPHQDLLEQVPEAGILGTIAGGIGGGGFGALHSAANAGARSQLNDAIRRALEANHNDVQTGYDMAESTAPPVAPEMRPATPPATQASPSQPASESLHGEAPVAEPAPPISHAGLHEAIQNAEMVQEDNVHPHSPEMQDAHGYLAEQLKQAGAPDQDILSAYEEEQKKPGAFLDYAREFAASGGGGNGPEKTREQQYRDLQNAFLYQQHLVDTLPPPNTNEAADQHYADAIEHMGHMAEPLLSDQEMMHAGQGPEELVNTVEQHLAKHGYLDAGEPPVQESSAPAVQGEGQQASPSPPLIAEAPAPPPVDTTPPAPVESQAQDQPEASTGQTSAETAPSGDVEAPAQVQAGPAFPSIVEAERAKQIAAELDTPADGYDPEEKDQFDAKARTYPKAELQAARNAVKTGQTDAAGRPMESDVYRTLGDAIAAHKGYNPATPKPPEARPTESPLTEAAGTGQRPSQQPKGKAPSAPKQAAEPGKKASAIDDELAQELRSADAAVRSKPKDTNALGRLQRAVNEGREASGQPRTMKLDRDFLHEEAARMLASRGDKPAQPIPFTEDQIRNRPVVTRPRESAVQKQPSKMQLAKKPREENSAPEPGEAPAQSQVAEPDRGEETAAGKPEAKPVEPPAQVKNATLPDEDDNIPMGSHYAQMDKIAGQYTGSQVAHQAQALAFPALRAYDRAGKGHEGVREALEYLDGIEGAGTRYRAAQYLSAFMDSEDRSELFARLRGAPAVEKYLAAVGKTAWEARDQLMMYVPTGPERAERYRAALRRGVTPLELWRSQRSMMLEGGRIVDELSDQNSKLLTQNIPQMQTRRNLDIRFGQGTLPTLIHLDSDLYDRVPVLKHITAEITFGPGIQRDMGKAGRDAVYMPGEMHIQVYAKSQELARVSLLHEIQHAIAYHTGLPAGSAPELFPWAMVKEIAATISDDDLREMADELERLDMFDPGINGISSWLNNQNDREKLVRGIMYAFSEGEMLAQQTEHRADLSDAERKAHPPRWVTHVKPRYDQVYMAASKGEKLSPSERELARQFGWRSQTPELQSALNEKQRQIKKDFLTKAAIPALDSIRGRVDPTKWDQDFRANNEQDYHDAFAAVMDIINNDLTHAERERMFKFPSETSWLGQQVAGGLISAQTADDIAHGVDSSIYKNTDYRKYSGRDTGPVPKHSYQYVERVAEIAQEMRKRLAAQGLDDVGIRVARHVLNSALHPVDASASYLSKLIVIAMGGDQFTGGHSLLDLPIRDAVKMAAFRLDHEAYHAMRQLGLLTDAEHATMTRFAQAYGVDANGKIVRAKTVRDSFYGQVIGNALYHDQLSKYGKEDRRTIALEEAAATATQFLKQEAVPTRARTVMGKLVRILRGILRALGAMRFASPEALYVNANDIAGHMLDGKIGRRGRDYVHGMETSASSIVERGGMTGQMHMANSPSRQYSLDRNLMYSGALEAAKVFPEPRSTSIHMRKWLERRVKKAEAALIDLDGFFKNNPRPEKADLVKWIEDHRFVLHNRVYYGRGDRDMPGPGFLQMNNTDDVPIAHFSSYTLRGNDSVNHRYEEVAFHVPPGTPGGDVSVSHIGPAGTIFAYMKSELPIDGVASYHVEQGQSDYWDVPDEEIGDPAAYEAKRAAAEEQFNALSAEAEERRLRADALIEDFNDSQDEWTIELDHLYNIAARENGEYQHNGTHRRIDLDGDAGGFHTQANGDKQGYGLAGNGVPESLHEQIWEIADAVKQYHEASGEADNFMEENLSDDLPEFRDINTPFRHTWPEVMFRAAFLRAVLGGYGKMSWNSGDTIRGFSGHQRYKGDFYDKRWPSYARSWLKQFGTQVQRANYQTADSRRQGGDWHADSRDIAHLAMAEVQAEHPSWKLDDIDRWGDLVGDIESEVEGRLISAGGPSRMAEIGLTDLAKDLKEHLTEVPGYRFPDKYKRWSDVPNAKKLIDAIAEKAGAKAIETAKEYNKQIEVTKANPIYHLDITPEMRAHFLDNGGQLFMARGPMSTSSVAPAPTTSALGNLRMPGATYLGQSPRDRVMQVTREVTNYVPTQFSKRASAAVTSYLVKAGRNIENASPRLGVGRVLGKGLRQLAHGITTLTNLPGVGYYQYLRGQLMGDIVAGQEYSDRLSNLRDKLSDQDVDQFLRYMLTRDADPATITNPMARELAEKSKELLIKFGRENVRLGRMDQAQLDKYEGRYLPRKYFEYIENELSTVGIRIGKSSYLRERLPGMDKQVFGALDIAGYTDRVEALREQLSNAMSSASADDRRRVGLFLADKLATTRTIKDSALRSMLPGIKQALADIEDHINTLDLITLKPDIQTLNGATVYGPYQMVKRFGQNYVHRAFWRAANRKLSIGSVLESSAANAQITDPVALSAIAIAQQNRDLAVMHFFEAINAFDDVMEKQDPAWKRVNWIHPDSMVLYNGRQMAIDAFLDHMEMARKNQSYIENPLLKKVAQRELDKMQAIADAHPRIPDSQVGDDYVRVPNTDAYGNMRGALIHRAIFNDIKGTLGLRSQAAKGVIGAYDRFLGKFMSFFKQAMTTLNFPKGHARAIFQNISNLYLSGVGGHDAGLLFLTPAANVQTWRWFLKAAGYMRENHPLWVKAQELGVKHGTFTSTEMRHATDLLQRLKIEERIASAGKHGAADAIMDTLSVLDRAVRKVGGKAADLFNYWDTISRFAKFIHEVQVKKASHGDAIIEANEWQPDYSLVPDWVRMMRGTVFPFLTIQYKMAPKLIDQVMSAAGDVKKGDLLSAGDKLLRVAVPIALWTSLTSLAAGTLLGMDKREHDAMRQAMADYYRRNAGIIPIPIRQPDGSIVLVDMGVQFPWTQLIQAGRYLAEGDTNQALSSAGLGVPAADVYAAFKTGRDPYTGYQLWSDTATNGEKNVAQLVYIINYLTPPVARGLLDPWVGAMRGVPIGFGGGEIARAIDYSFWDGLSVSGKPIEGPIYQGLRSATGFNFYSFDPISQIQRNFSGYTNQIRELTQERGTLRNQAGRLMAAIRRRPDISEERKEQLLAQRRAAIREQELTYASKIRDVSRQMAEYGRQVRPIILWQRRHGAPAPTREPDATATPPR